MRTFVLLTVIFIINLCLGFSLNIFGQVESTRAEIFNYEIGDIFHTYGWNRPSGYLQWEEHTTFNILDKYYSPSGDTLYYVQEIFRETHEVFWDTTWYENYLDTLSIMHLDSLILSGNADSVYSDPLLYNGRIINSLIYISPGYDYEEKYSFIKGCGGPYSYHREGFDGTADGYDLVYFLKGDEEWGEPFYVKIPENEHTQPQSLAVYPNPAKDYINIAISDIPKSSFEAYIYSILGNVIKISNGHSDQVSQVDVSNIAKGIYILRVKLKNRELIGRFIKE